MPELRSPYPIPEQPTPLVTSPTELDVSEGFGQTVISEYELTVA